MVARSLGQRRKKVMARAIEVEATIFDTLPLFLLAEMVASLAGLLGGPKFTGRFGRAVYSV
jgi:hypothetical protein